VAPATTQFGVEPVDDVAAEFTDLALLDRQTITDARRGRNARSQEQQRVVDASETDGVRNRLGRLSHVFYQLLATDIVDPEREARRRDRRNDRAVSTAQQRPAPTHPRPES
jgi:hypothetical protein